MGRDANKINNMSITVQTKLCYLAIATVSGLAVGCFKSRELARKERSCVATCWQGLSEAERAPATSCKKERKHRGVVENL